MAEQERCPYCGRPLVEIRTNIYDKEETYPNCTVQVLTNTVTGDVSVGWWKNGESEPSEIDFDYEAED